jgi:hypothetical protein
VIVSRPVGSASDSLALVARVLALAAHPGEDALAGALAAEARTLLGVPAAALVSLPDRGAGARVAAAGGPVRAVPATALGAAAALAASGDEHARVREHECEELAGPLGVGFEPASMLLVRLPGAGARVLALAASGEDDLLDDATLELAVAFAGAASAAFAHQASGAAHREADHHAALARAAKTLNESLDLSTLLTRICHEAAVLIGADSAVVYRVTETDELAVEAAHGLPPEQIGFRMARGAGLAGKVLLEDRPMMTDDY